MRRFDAGEVEELARTTGRTRRSGASLTTGELAAAVFARLEQRQSLSEIVRALKVDPKKVRALYHEWRTGLKQYTDGLQRHHHADQEEPLTIRPRSL